MRASDNWFPGGWLEDNGFQPDELPENWQQIHEEVFGPPADASETKATCPFFLFPNPHHPTPHIVWCGTEGEGWLMNC